MSGHTSVWQQEIGLFITVDSSEIVRTSVLIEENLYASVQFSLNSRSVLISYLTQQMLSTYEKDEGFWDCNAVQSVESQPCVASSFMIGE
jgi:hypothetical protein